MHDDYIAHVYSRGNKVCPENTSGHTMCERVMRWITNYIRKHKVGSFSRKDSQCPNRVSWTTFKENATNNVGRSEKSHNIGPDPVVWGSSERNYHTLSGRRVHTCIPAYMHACHCALRRALLRFTGACSADSFLSSAAPRELFAAGTAVLLSASSAMLSPPLAASSRSGSYSDPDS